MLLSFALNLAEDILPFPFAAHMVTMLLIWSVFFPAIWIAMMEVAMEFILAQSREFLP